MTANRPKASWHGFSTRALPRFLFLLLLTLTAAAPLPRLRITGKQILDPDDRPVTLRGVNLGNWLLFEPGGLGGALGKFPDQHTLFTTLHDRFGPAEGERLISLYRDHFITPRDFELLSRFKFNLLRIGFDYSLLEDDARPKQLRPNAFKYLDFAVEQAERHGLYVLFDLHGAQERQIAGKQSGRVGYTRFWDDPDAQDRSLWLWEQVARRYRGRTNVLGYEPLNEPWGKDRTALRDYCLRWYPVIRNADPDAIVVFPGWNKGVDFYGKPADHGWTNAMFDQHFYPGHFSWGTQELATHHDHFARTLPAWAATMDKLDAPLLIGEFNVVSKRIGGGEMTRRYLDDFTARGWPYTIWTYKELHPAGGIRENMWMLVTNRDPLPVTDARTAPLKDVETFLASLSTMPLIPDDDLLHWLTTTDSPSPLPPAPATRPTRPK